MDLCMLDIQDKGGFMNINIAKEEIKSMLGRKVLVKVYGMRNKINSYEGVINAIYPNIFTIKNDREEKSFTYADLITGEIKIKYL